MKKHIVWAIAVLIALPLLCICIRSCTQKKVSEYWKGRVEVAEQRARAAIEAATQLEQEHATEIEAANKRIEVLEGAQAEHTGHIDSLSTVVTRKEEQLRNLEATNADASEIIANLREQVALHKKITLEWKGKYETQVKITDEWIFKYAQMEATAQDWKSAALEARTALDECMTGIVATRKELARERRAKKVYMLGTLVACALGAKELLK